MLGGLAFYGLLLYLVNLVSESEDDSVGPISNHLSPQHEFIIHEQNFKKDKSTKTKTVRLIIEPYVFKQREKAKKIGDTATFSCNGCAKQKKYIKAKVKRIGPGDSPNDFELINLLF